MQLCMRGNQLACIRQRSVHRASNSSTQTDSEALGTDLMPGTASVCCCITRSSRLVDVTVMSVVTELELIMAAIRGGAREVIFYLTLMHFNAWREAACLLLPDVDLTTTRPWGRAVNLLHRGAFMPAHIHACPQD